MDFSFAIKRVKRELRQMKSKEEFGKLELIGNCYTRLRGEILGPPGTPYEGGKFRVRIKIPRTYPYTPPTVRFITLIWHPNIINATGDVCLDVLNDEWAACMTLESVMLSLQCLLASPIPEDPLDLTVAKQYIKDYNLFVETAKFWTHKFAGGSYRNPEFEDKMKRLEGSGFSTSLAAGFLSEKDSKV